MDDKQETQPLQVLIDKYETLSSSSRGELTEISNIKGHADTNDLDNRKKVNNDFYHVSETCNGDYRKEGGEDIQNHLLGNNVLTSHISHNMDRSKSFQGFGRQQRRTSDDTIVQEARDRFIKKYGTIAVTPSGNQFSWELEDTERLYSTRRDSRRVRALKSLHLLPKTPTSRTLAEVGVQVQLTSYQNDVERDLLVKLEDTNTKFLKHREKSATALNESSMQLEHLENVLEAAEKARDKAEVELLAELEKTEQLENDFGIAKRNLKEKCKRLEREKQELMQERDEAVSSQEKRILDAAFLEEERDDAVRLAAQRWRTLEELNAKLIAERQEKDDYRALYIQSKAEYAENISKLTAQLTDTLSEKRYLIKKGVKNVAKACTMEDTLKTAELYVEQLEENKRLIEQLELMSTSSVTKDIQLQQLQDELEDVRLLLKAQVDSNIDTQEVSLPRQRLIQQHNSESYKALTELLQVCQHFGKIKSDRPHIATKEDYAQTIKPTPNHSSTQTKSQTPPSTPSFGSTSSPAKQTKTPPKCHDVTSKIQPADHWNAHKGSTTDWDNSNVYLRSEILQGEVDPNAMKLENPVHPSHSLTLSDDSMYSADGSKEEIRLHATSPMLPFREERHIPRESSELLPTNTSNNHQLRPRGILRSTFSDRSMLH